MRNQPFSEDEFKSIYSRVPRLTVDLVIRNSDGLLLTLREKHGWAGQWHLPGGTVYLGEKVLETVHRIAFEELGIDVSVDKFLGFIEYPSEGKERGYGYSVSLVFECRPLTEEIKLDNQVSKYQFFKILPENTISEQKKFLQW